MCMCDFDERPEVRSRISWTTTEPVITKRQELGGLVKDGLKVLGVLK